MMRSGGLLYWGRVPTHSASPPLVGGELSFKALAWAFDQDIASPAKAVLIAMAYRDNHDEPHGCYPSIPRIARDCGISTRTAQNCIRYLEGRRLITSRPRPNKSTFYSMPLAWVVQDVHQGGAPRAPGVVQDVHPEPKGLTVSEPKREPGLRKQVKTGLLNRNQSQLIEDFERSKTKDPFELKIRTDQLIGKLRELAQRKG